MISDLASLLITVFPSISMTQKLERSNENVESDLASSDASTPNQRPKQLRLWIGVSLIILSGVFWFSLFAVPFLPLSLAQKTTIGIFLFAGVQAAWWIGAAFVGPQAIKKLLSWFRRKTDADP